MVRQYEMSWAACLAPARRKRRRRWLTAGLGDVHIVATSVTIYLRATPPAAGPLDVDSGLLTSGLAA